MMGWVSRMCCGLAGLACAPELQQIKTCFCPRSALLCHFVFEHGNLCTTGFVKITIFGMAEAAGKTILGQNNRAMLETGAGNRARSGADSHQTAERMTTSTVSGNADSGRLCRAFAWRSTLARPVPIPAGQGLLKIPVFALLAASCSSWFVVGSWPRYLVCLDWCWDRSVGDPGTVSLFMEEPGD